MAHSVETDWILNSGNEPVYTKMMGARLSSPVFTQFVYDTEPLIPYLGQPGWLLEAPEFNVENQSDFGSIFWLQVFVEREVMWKCIRHDRGLYRVIWTQPHMIDRKTVIYPNAKTRGEDFRWDFTQLRAILHDDKVGWRIERMDTTDDKEQEVVWTPTTVTCSEWNDDMVCHRLVEV